MNLNKKGAGATQSLISRKKVWTKSFVVLVISTIVLLIISLFTGVYDIFNQPDGVWMFTVTRIPRTVSLALTGVALSLSGLVMQLITQNRMSSPTTTGTTEWAGLGLMFVYILFPSPTLMQRMTGSIIFSFCGTIFFFILLRKIRLKSSLIVPIVGMMLGSVVSAFSTFLSLTFQLSQNIEAWFIGSFSNVQIGRYEYLWLIVIVVIAIYFFADRLTLAGLGEDISKSLGVNYQNTVLIATILVSFATGLVTSVIGNVPFLGLIVPNVVSMIRGDDVRSNIPWVCMVGIITITLADILSRVLIMPFEVPVSLILGTVGAVVFIIILVRQRRVKNV